MTNTPHITIFTPDIDSNIELPLSDSKVSAGFPSPADDHFSLKLDITKEIIKNPADTFYARVSGVSMIDDGINDGDLLVIDKSVEPYDNCLAVCYIDGEFTKCTTWKKHRFNRRSRYRKNTGTSRKYITKIYNSLE